MKMLLKIILLLLVFAIGIHIGRAHTIKTVEIMNVANDECYIGFGEEVHMYTF